MNLSKEKQQLYTDSYKELLKAIKGINGKTCCVHGPGDLILLR